MKRRNAWFNRASLMERVLRAMVLPETEPGNFFVYKNQLYKNKEAQNVPKFKNKLRTTQASNSSGTRKLTQKSEILPNIGPFCPNLKNIEPN